MRQIELVPYTIDLLERSWDWLQDAEVRRLTMTPEFTRADQQRFFDALPSRQDYRVWGVELSGVGPIGAAGLKNIRDSAAEYWGYIGNKDWWGRGLGIEIVEQVEEQARAIGLRFLHLKVTAENERAIRLYGKAGYRQTGAEGGIILMQKQIGEVPA